MSGGDFDVEVVNFLADDLQSPAFLAVNPAGQVPAVLIDGEALTENVAILYTLATMFPDLGILPLDGPMASGQALRRLAFCTAQLHPHVTASFFPERFCSASPEATAQFAGNACKRLKSKLLTLEPVLAVQDWVLSDFSIADVYLFWITARTGVLELDASGLEAVVAHADRVRALPLVQRVLERERGFVTALEQSGTPIPPLLRARIVLE